MIEFYLSSNCGPIAETEADRPDISGHDLFASGAFEYNTGGEIKSDT